MGDPPQSTFIRGEPLPATEVSMVNTEDMRGVITELHLLTSDLTNPHHIHTRLVNPRDSTTATRS